MKQSESKLGFGGTWSMAVGGMVGGGIFSTLGVIIGIAGAWTWLSFVAAGHSTLNRPPILLRGRSAGNRRQEILPVLQWLCLPCLFLDDDGFAV